MSEEVPDGWVDVSLGELLREPLRNGHSARPSLDGSGVRALTLTAVTYGEFSEKNTKMTVANPTKVADLWLEPGDLLIERSNTPELVGTARLYRGPRQWAIFPDLLIRARLLEVASPDYVEALLLSRGSRNYFMESAQGTAGSMPKIDQGVIERLRVPLPPLVEQYRIVGMVDALLAQVTATRQRLASVVLILKRLRQSVLAAGCSGRLTEDWQGRRTVRSAEDLPAAAVDDVPALPEIPEDWKLVPLRAVVERFQYGTSDKANGDERTGIPVLRMGNVQDGRIDLSDLKYVSPSELRTEFLVQAGDVLFNRTNSPELVGKTAVVQDTRPMAFASYLIRMRTNTRLLAPEFLGHWLNSWWGRQWARHVRTDGVGQSNINATKLASMPIPLPTIAEQREITARIDQLLDLANTIERRVVATSASADALAQGILAKAFGGELVPTEAELARADGRDYESAQALLARIHGERAVTAAPPKGQRGGAQDGSPPPRGRDRARASVSVARRKPNRI